MTGFCAQQPFSGSTTTTKSFSNIMSGLWFSNDGGSDITIQVNSDVFTVKSGEVFDDFLPPFNQIVITNSGGSSFRGYVRG